MHYYCNVVFTTNLVTGQRSLRKCEDARKDAQVNKPGEFSAYCGPHGNLFEKAA